MILLSKI